jgi:MFS family permease
LSVAAKPIAAEFRLSPVKLGYLFSSFLWVYFWMLVPMGMAVWSAATICTGVAPGLFAIMCTCLVMGAGEATTYPSGGRVLREWVPRNERGFATALMNSGSYAGPALGALFVSWLITILGWRAGFVVSGVIGFFGLPHGLSGITDRKR